MTAKTYRPQLWMRTVEDPELGCEIRQFIQHSEDGEWTGWEIYDGGNVESEHIKLSGGMIPLGFREVTE